MTRNGFRKTVKQLVPLESEIVRQCLQWLQLHGIVAWRNNTTGVFDPRRGRFRKFTGRKGVADILGLLRPSGRMIAVECKRPGQRTTPEQRAFLDDVGASGGLACVCYSVDDLARAVALGAGGRR